MNKFALCALVAGTVAAAPAFAGGRYDDRYSDNGPEYADVVSVQPIYQSVRVDQPRRECWDERVTYAQPRPYNDGSTAIGTILGAVAGGVIGHQFGGGNGRDAATAVGAVVGAGVGNNVARQNQRYYPDEERTSVEQRCRTVSDVHTEQRIDGYDVAYRYGGRIYHTQTQYDPGRRIPVDVDVRPSQY